MSRTCKLFLSVLSGLLLLASIVCSSQCAEAMVLQASARAVDTCCEAETEAKVTQSCCCCSSPSTTSSVDFQAAGCGCHFEPFQGLSFGANTFSIGSSSKVLKAQAAHFALPSSDSSAIVLVRAKQLALEPLRRPPERFYILYRALLI